MKRAILLVVGLLMLAGPALAGVKPTQEPKHAAPPLAAAQQPPSAEHQPATPPAEGAPAGEAHAAEAKAEPQEGHEAGAEPGAAAEHGGGHEAESPWKTVARLFNFALLAGSLVYLLRSPFGAFLEGRQSQIKKSLTDAASTREDATRQMSVIDQKLAALPADLEELKRRGAAEIAAEEERIRQAAEVERQRMVENGKREIERRAHLAERRLLERAGTLAVSLATDRVKRTITDADQARLVDRYLDQVRPETIGS